MAYPKIISEESRLDTYAIEFTKNTRYNIPRSDPMPRNLEDAARECSGSQFKILYIIARQTIGFKKASDRISLSQFQKKTGLDRKTIIEALEELKKGKWIGCEMAGKTKYAGKIYWIPLDIEVGEFFHYTIFKGSGNIPPEWGNFSTGNTPKLVEEFHTQETTDLETIKETEDDKNNEKEKFGMPIRQLSIVSEDSEKAILQRLPQAEIIRLRKLAGENLEARGVKPNSFGFESLKKHEMALIASKQAANNQKTA